MQHLFTVYVLDMNVTLLRPHVKQSGAYVFKQPIVPPGLVIHFYYCIYLYHTVDVRFLNDITSSAINPYKTMNQPLLCFRWKL